MVLAMEPEPIRFSEHPIRAKDIDSDALRVLARLSDYGFYAYLVGGSVRDLLLGRKPKDFDVATSAQPDEIKRLFRRCRLIGRRFRLAHIIGDKGQIIETATFRAKPEDCGEAQLITDDNNFGTPRTDALRRDFTVNALFYDAQRQEVIDYVDGLEDLDNRLLRTIGDPVIRFREDPVRMMRAVKFAARLDFELEPSLRAAVVSQRAELGKAAVARLYEEILRLLNGGAAAESILLMDELRLLEVLIPEVSATLARADDEQYERIFNLLNTYDDVIAKGKKIPNGILLAGILWPVVESVLAELSSEIRPVQARELIEEITRPFAVRLSVPRRAMETALAVMESQLRFDRIRRKRNARSGFARTSHYAQSVCFAELRAQSGQLTDTEIEAWASLAQEFPPPPLFEKRTRGRRGHGRQRQRRGRQRR